MSNVYNDPKDTPFYLMQEGWERVELDDEILWVGVYEGETTTMDGVLKRMPSGERRFYAREPTDAFVEAAHDGGCLVTYRDRITRELDGLVRIHFERHPDTFGDGIDRIESLMR